MHYSDYITRTYRRPSMQEADPHQPSNFGRLDLEIGRSYHISIAKKLLDERVRGWRPSEERLERLELVSASPWVKDLLSITLT